MEKLVIPYEHDPADLTQIWMAVSQGAPADSEWKAAYRDTINGQLVVWVKYDDEVPQGNIWIRDRAGTHRRDRAV
jgi:hypothetical protein